MASARYRRASHDVEPSRRKLLALVVEDDQQLNGALCDTLSEGQFECVQAFSAAEAMEFLKGPERPDIIVVESMLADTNGFQFCALVKLDPRTNAIPVLILLDRPIEKIRLQGLRIEPDRYLAQDPGVLLDTVREELALCRQRKRAKIEFFVEMTLQSDLKLLDNINTVLGRALKAAAIDEIEEQKIKYATLEMGHNAIEWGNKNRPELKVRVILCVEPKRFWAKIIDDGAGFDASHLPHASNPDDPIAHLEVREKMGIREGGFGILLAREFMDEVQYSRKGNEVLLVKYFSREHHGAAAPSENVST